MIEHYIVAVVDFFADDIPSAYVISDGCGQYLAIYGWAPEGEGEIEEEIIGVFTEVEPAVRRLWGRRWAMNRLRGGDLSDLGPP